MRPDDAALAAVGLTLAVSVGIILYLHSYIAPLLEAKGVAPLNARFWAAASHVLLVLGPVTLQLLMAEAVSLRSPAADGTSHVLAYAKWGLCGHLTLVGLIASTTVMSGFGRSVPVWVPPEHADDLNRLMSRVRELRAREIVERADADVIELGPEDVRDPGRT